jgi:6-phosphogluconate dehydrogenase
LNPQARIAAWLWVASGKVHFADTEKVRRRLDQSGIEFVG